MLEVTVSEVEVYDEANEEFFTLPETKLRLEHSLVSLSKWEAHWETPFLTAEEKTDEQVYWYFHAMCLDEDVDPGVFQRLGDDNTRKINDYVASKMTATWFSDEKSRGKSQTVTAELIYYWMIALNIPFECETWHLNRLFTLIKVTNEKNSPEKKMSRREVMNRNKALNDARRAKMNTKG